MLLKTEIIYRIKWVTVIIQQSENAYAGRQSSIVPSQNKQKQSTKSKRLVNEISELRKTKLKKQIY